MGGCFSVGLKGFRGFQSKVKRWGEPLRSRPLPALERLPAACFGTAGIRKQFGCYLQVWDHVRETSGRGWEEERMESAAGIVLQMDDRQAGRYYGQLWKTGARVCRTRKFTQKVELKHILQDGQIVFRGLRSVKKIIFGLSNIIGIGGKDIYKPACYNMLLLHKNSVKDRCCQSLLARMQLLPRSH